MNIFINENLDVDILLTSCKHLIKEKYILVEVSGRCKILQKQGTKTVQIHRKPHLADPQFLHAGVRDGNLD